MNPAPPVINTLSNPNSPLRRSCISIAAAGSVKHRGVACVASMTSELIAYYEAISAVLVPHLRDRPYTMKRHYTSPRSPYVWEKDAPAEMPSWIRVCPQPAKSRGGALVRYPLVNSRRALRWMVEYGCIDMHVWLSRCDRPDRPDQLLVDLDPKGGTFTQVVEAAL